MTPEQALRQQRLKKLQLFHSQGIETYGCRFEKTASCAVLAKDYPAGTSLRAAGRLTARREHGKSLFADVRDSSGKIQIYAKEGQLDAERLALLASLDVGDWVGIAGKLFHTKTGEPTIAVEDVILLAKSLRPIPEKWHGLKDQEVRYRQRYLDLIANPEVRSAFEVRTRVIRELRRLLDTAGYLEVETPMMHAMPGGATGEPFATHHRALDLPLFLRLAPELYLKRLLVGGFERVYELSKSFRNEGLSPRHNPEFTMLEAYAAYDDYEGMMRLTQHLLTETARAVMGTTTLTYQGKTMALHGTWRRLSFAELVKARYGVTPSDGSEVLLHKLGKRRGGAKGPLSRSQIVRLIEEEFDPETHGEPVLITDYWTDLSPLAKARRDDPLLAERFELFLGGLELANGYSELNDPLEQRRRFEAQLDGVPRGRRHVDEEFVEALEYGMPPAGGLGIGIDRFVMLLTNQPSIRDVILFPLLRPSSPRTVRQQRTVNSEP